MNSCSTANNRVFKLSNNVNNKLICNNSIGVANGTRYLRLNNSLNERASINVKLLDLHDKAIPYEKACALQHRLKNSLIRSRNQENRHSHSTDPATTPVPASDAGHVCGYLLLVQHPAVYTLGSAAGNEHVLFDLADPPCPVFRSERGGDVTYHAPGQLVVYPVLDLAYFTKDLHWHMRQLEELTIQALDEVSGLKGERVVGMTGVWVQEAKVAAIGVRASRWIVYHGVAINLNIDLAGFNRIVPCGLHNKAVTRVADLELQSAPGNDLADVDPFAIGFEGRGAQSVGGGQVKGGQIASDLTGRVHTSTQSMGMETEHMRSVSGDSSGVVVGVRQEEACRGVDQQFISNNQQVSQMERIDSREDDSCEWQELVQQYSASTPEVSGSLLIKEYAVAVVDVFEQLFQCTIV